MIGTIDGDVKQVTLAEVLENSYEGAQGARYELRPEDLLAADKKARAAGLDLIGIFHSHPDCDAYFSKPTWRIRARGIRSSYYRLRAASSITPTASCRTPIKPPRRKKS